MLGARPRPQILRIEFDTNDPIAKGMPKESIAWVENSPVFEVLTAGSAGILPALSAKGEPADKMSALPAVHVIAWYPKDKDPLLSGWLLGGDIMTRTADCSGHDIAANHWQRIRCS